MNPKQQWIGAKKNASAPLFRRDFACNRPLAEATLLISGLGCHEAWINGARVGDHVLDPAQTDYEMRVFYVRHDVTCMINEGLHTLGVVLGNGWYNQDRVWGEDGLPYGPPRLMAELHLRYDDGTVDVVRADNQWRWTPGPITDNNVYAGEGYDARLEIDGWCRPGFDDSDWQPVIPMPAPGGEFQEQAMPPMRRVEELIPVAIDEREPGIFVVDFGRNFSGWNRIQVNAPAGTEIVLRYAETVFPDGTIDTASTGVFATNVEQIDRYVCRGNPCCSRVIPDSELEAKYVSTRCETRENGAETWEPRFTYHGFRYVEVSGWPGDLSPEHITGVVVHNDLPVIGTFESADKRLNQLHEMALWTHRSNMHGLPEDCPAREKCGWLGDANLVAEYSLWNYDGKLFWEKFLDDIETTRTFNDGIPGNIAPGKRGSRRKANPDWAAAFIMVPWYLYLFSGDKGIVKRHWQGMQRLMEHFQERAQDWILSGGYGDYFDPGTDAIVMHTPQFLTTTLWFYRCADVMAVMADALDAPDSAAMYRDWRDRIAVALKDRCYDHTEGSFGSQTANAMALAFNVHPDENRRILDALVKDIRERDNHMNVGVMGVRVILEVLTRHGHGNLALALMHQNTYPSFGHLIERGATTLWECWGEEEHDRIHGARSLNHPFMGGYDNWFFNTLAGIRPDAKAPGFTHFFLEPRPVKGLD
ncbi:MAG: family 78 glycoside hydrolase catalytic domain, partial [Lentisphaeria bacterium]